MKWAKEIKIGLLSILVIVIMIWGYKFLKGKNVFSYSNTYRIRYEYIDQLTASSPVMVNGFKVGSVTKIFLDPEDPNQVIVQIDVDGIIKLPQDAKAILYSVGIVGGKGIILEFDSICEENCLPSGSFIDGEIRGLLSSMVPESEVDLYLQKLQTGLGGILDSIGFSSEEGQDQTAGDLREIVSNLASITARLDGMIARTDASIEQSIGDIKSFTGTLKQNETHLSNVLANLDVLSEQLSRAGVDQTLVRVDSTVNDLSASVKDLRGILSSANQSFENIDDIIQRIEAGQGSLGKIIARDSLYEDINLTVQHLNLLLQDIRMNPRRYVNVSIIGRKNQSYEKPEDDPGLQ